VFQEHKEKLDLREKVAARVSRVVQVAMVFQDYQGYKENRVEMVRRVPWETVVQRARGVNKDHKEDWDPLEEEEIPVPLVMLENQV